MKNELEEQMKRLTDEASLEELLPGFDKDALWGSISDELHPGKPAKKRFLLGWVSHAAAILLAIAGTWLFLHFNQRTRSDAVAVGIPVTTPQVPVKNEKVVAVPQQALPQVADAPIVPHNKQASSSAPYNPASPVASVKEAAPVMILQPPVPVTEGPKIMIPDPQPVVTVAKKTRKVMHYLDLDLDESAYDVVPHPAAPVYVQMKLNRPDIPNNTNQQMPLKELVIALAR